MGDPGGDRESTSTRAVACYSLCDDHSIAANRYAVFRLGPCGIYDAFYFYLHGGSLKIK